MINTEDFIKRLQKVMDFYSESSSSFADKIGVPRSSISHILSGRNKPSLDFVLKILNSFPEIELYWLLNGKGSFPNELKHDEKLENQSSKLTQMNLSSNNDKSIERIVIFYSDGSFQNFENL